MAEEIPVGDVVFVARMGDEYGIKNGNIKILNVSDIETRSSECFEKELEVLFELPAEDTPPKEEGLSLINKVVTPLKEKMLTVKTAYADELGSYKNSGGIRARLLVNYNRNKKGDVRINKITGYWVPSIKGLIVTERKVNYGINFLAKTGVARPSGNFFTMTPKWGYVPSSIGANGAVSSARGRTNYKKNTLVELEVRF